MRNTGVNLHGFKGASDETYVDIMANLGFKYTFSGVFEHARLENIANLLARRNMAYETIHAPFGHMNDIWLDCEGGDKMLEELCDCVDCCVIAGAPYAVVHLSAGMTPPSITDIGRMRFGKLVEYANSKNVRIAFENQRMLANLAWALETFSESDGVFFCWDCGHESCFTPGREYMSLFGNRLACTHIHDNLGIFNQDDHLIPFDGKIDFNRFAHHIRTSGYKGTFMLEILQRQSTRYDDMTVETYLQRAAEAVNKLVKLTDGEGI